MKEWMKGKTKRGISKKERKDTFRPRKKELKKWMKDGANKDINVKRKRNSRNELKNEWRNVW